MEFQFSRKVLEGKAQKLRQQGMGKRPKKAKSLTEQEEQILWECGLLRKQSPLPCKHHVVAVNDAFWP